MAQPHVFITLNIPEPGFSGRPVVVSYNPILLRFFKHSILQDWESRVANSPTEEDLIVNKAEFERLRLLLDVFIPNGEDANND